MKRSALLFASFFPLLAGVALANDAGTLCDEGLTNVYGAPSCTALEPQPTPLVMLDAIATRSPSRIRDVLERGALVECFSCPAALEGLLFDSDESLRQVAAYYLRQRTLGVFGVGETFARLLETISLDGNATRRAHAAEALGRFLSPAAIDPLAAQLANEREPSVRARIVRALGELGSASHVSGSLSDGDPAVRREALRAMLHMHREPPAQSLELLLRDPDARVRQVAAETCERFRVADSEATLFVLAEDQDPLVRSAAFHALLRLVRGGEAKGRLLSLGDKEPHPLVRDVALMARFLP